MKFMATALFLTTIWFGPGVGMARSWSSREAPFETRTRALFAIV